MGRVQGKVAFVTGAARGQGRSHAIRLAEEGADIIAVDLCGPIDSVDHYAPSTREDLEQTVKEVERLDRRIVARVADVRDVDALRAVTDEGAVELGGLDIVVANAGIAGFGRAHELTEQAWRDEIDINLTGVWHTAKVAVPHMLARGAGSMIFTSSVAGLRGVANVAHYVSAKHGIVGLMRSMAIELGPHHIRVNTVNPTTVDTAMIQNEGIYRLFVPDGENLTKESVAPAFEQINTIPVPWVEAIDVSNAVLFLASEEARYISGISLPVAAGATAR